jgi:hypothetical protein
MMRSMPPTFWVMALLHRLDGKKLRLGAPARM